MPEWKTNVNKMVITGMQTVTVDDLKEPTKLRQAVNVRARQAGGVIPRPGLFLEGSIGADSVHSIRRKPDSSGNGPLVVGIGTAVGDFDRVSGYTQRITGFSGKPLSIVMDNPFEAGKVWAYIYDSQQQRKMDESGNVDFIGIAPPGKSTGSNYSLTPTSAPGVATGAAGNLTGAYRYKYRFRSSATGVRSNYSAQSAEVTPSAQQVDLSSIATTLDTQVDKVDIFRIGGALTVYTYVDTINEGTTTYSDNKSDTDIAANEVQESFERDQPWVLTDASGVTTANNPLARVWGPFEGFFLACGDPNAPGELYWTNGNDPDSADRANHLTVSPGNEPLVNGLMYRGRSYVFSSNRLYEIYPQISGLATFEVLPTACSRGLVAPYAFAVGPEIYFLSHDGIFATNGGGPERMLSGDIANLFPHEGFEGRPVKIHDVQPPDFTSTIDPARMRLAYHSGFLYFDYKDVNGFDWTLVYDFSTEGWWFDGYNSQVTMHYSEEGEHFFSSDFKYAASDVLIGSRDGNIFRYRNGILDNGNLFTCRVWTHFDDLGAPRSQKLFGDALLEFDRDGVDVEVEPEFDNGELLDILVPYTSGSGREQYIHNLNDGNGRLARNMAMRFQWRITSADGARQGPQIYSWQPSAYPKPDETVQRAVEWHPPSEGLSDAYVWGVELWVDTEGDNVIFEVHRDQVNTGITFTANSDGEKRLRFTWPTQAFRARLLKLIPQSINTERWRLTRWSWLAEAEPPAVPNFDTNWQAPLGECDIAYVTGLRLEADTEGAAKSIVVESELEGLISTHTARLPGNALNLNGRKSVTYTFEPFRAQQVRIHSTGAGNVRLYDVCWHAHKEPPILKNWDATFEDLGRPHVIRAVEIFADTLGAAKSPEVQLDGTTHQTLSVNHNGRRGVSYELNRTVNGEYPRATTVRLFPTDANPGFLYRYRWIYEPEPEKVSHWNPRWTDGGYSGAKFVQGVRVVGDTLNQPKSLLAEYTDGSGVLKQTPAFVVSTPIKDTVPISFDQPFIAYHMRLRATDANQAFAYQEDWVFEPAPDLATVWETQETTHDLPGYQHVRRAFIPLISSADVTVRLVVDGSTNLDVVIPSTVGSYAKVAVDFPANKGLFFKYRASSVNGFRLFERDIEIYVKEWGSAGGYRILRPFGAPSRQYGARI